MAAKNAAAAKKREAKRELVFPDCGHETFKTTGGGFAQVPRVVPLVAALINEIGGRENAGSLYQVLWAHDWGQGIVEVKSPRSLLFQAGYTGSTGRADRTWQERVAILVSLGLVQTRPSGIEQHGFILLRDPYRAVLDLHDRNPNRIPKNWMLAFDSFAMDYNVDLRAARTREGAILAAGEVAE